MTDIRRFDEIDSTNEEARRLGDRGEQGPVWIVAARQTAGRGRRGRAWESPSGNFMGTLYLTPHCGPREAGELSFVAALAVHDAVSSLLPPPLRPALRLKWPNDLLHERAKLAGILLESSGVAGAEVAWVAIGMGINLAVHSLILPIIIAFILYLELHFEVSFVDDPVGSSFPKLHPCFPP